MASPPPSSRDRLVMLLGLVALALFAANFTLFLHPYLMPAPPPGCVLKAAPPDHHVHQEAHQMATRIKALDRALRMREAELARKASELEALARQREEEAVREARIRETLDRARSVLDKPVEIEVNLH
jgi:hypothetical protein